MRKGIGEELDRIDKLQPGQGMIDVFGFATGDLSRGSMGAGAVYGHRISKSLSAFAEAEAGYYYGETNKLGYEARAGFRGRW